MDQEGLKSCHIRKQRSLTNSIKSRGKGFKNITKGLDINRPFQVISSDISYIDTGEGFDYLCQVRDVHTNVVLASSQTNNMKKELVLKTIQFVKDCWVLPKDVIFHSDRDSQYTSFLLWLSQYYYFKTFIRRMNMKKIDLTKLIAQAMKTLESFSLSKAVLYNYQSVYRRLSEYYQKFGEIRYCPK